MPPVAQGSSFVSSRASTYPTWPPTPIWHRLTAWVCLWDPFSMLSRMDRPHFSSGQPRIRSMHRLPRSRSLKHGVRETRRSSRCLMFTALIRRSTPRHNGAAIMARLLILPTVAGRLIGVTQRQGCSGAIRVITPLTMRSIMLGWYRIPPAAGLLMTA